MASLSWIYYFNSRIIDNIPDFNLSYPFPPVFVFLLTLFIPSLSWRAKVNKSYLAFHVIPWRCIYFPIKNKINVLFIVIFLFLYYFLLLHHFIKNIWISGTANNQGSGRCHGYITRVNGRESFRCWYHLNEWTPSEIIDGMLA